MKKILVPCDFSDSAVQAFKFATDVARQSKGEVILLNIMELPMMYESAMAPAISFEEAYLKDMKVIAEKNFDKMKAKWAKEGPKVSTLVEFGPIHTVIGRMATEIEADLIVMGTKGASGFKEFTIGSNTEKIVRSSGIPVIAIKKGVAASSIRNIVFPNTLEDDQEVLALMVKALQTFFKATLHIVYINTPTNFKRDYETKSKLKSFAKRFMIKDYTLNVYSDLDQETGLAMFVKEVKGDMVAMSTHGRTGLSRWMSGSIAEDVVNHIECPIWTFRTK